MNCFSSADILLPVNCDLEKWAVIACDQYTSQPEYWYGVKKYVGDAPSTLHMFFPEAELQTLTEEHYAAYCKTMLQYLEDNTLCSYPSSYIYVERTLQNGCVRQGIVGVVDLERYDYDPKPETKIFATEATVLQRVPPRVALRKDAALEFSHTIIFCDDPDFTILEPIAAKRDQLKTLYDFELMNGGGNVRGYLLDGVNAAELSNQISRYETNSQYLVGDGNHSLVTAKLAYEALKASDPAIDWKMHPARYAMVELENIHSPAMQFESIYRIVVCDDPQKLVSDFSKLDAEAGEAVTWVIGEQEASVTISVPNGMLVVEVLQQFLDDWIASNGGEIDYVHGKDAVRSLAHNPKTVGFILPDVEKSILFPYVLMGKIMPRKSFSIGKAQEKRYYLEGRKIK